jgi:hypothetical protein
MNYEIDNKYNNTNETDNVTMTISMRMVNL